MGVEDPFVLQVLGLPDLVVAQKFRDLDLNVLLLAEYHQASCGEVFQIELFLQEGVIRGPLFGVRAVKLLGIPPLGIDNLLDHLLDILYFAEVQLFSD